MGGWKSRAVFTLCVRCACDERPWRGLIRRALRLGCSTVFSTLCFYASILYQPIGEKNVVYSHGRNSKIGKMSADTCGIMEAHLAQREGTAGGMAGTHDLDGR